MEHAEGTGARSKRRIGVMGGTLDPPHYAHLLIAEEARKGRGLERVIWVPAGDPPHKQGEQRASQEHRYAMALLATAGNPYFIVTRVELEREGPSYTFDTLEHFQAQWPDAELYFIIGADSALELCTWHRHADLIRQFRFIAATRPGYDLARLAEALPADYLERIELLTVPALDISSTDIRERARAGESLRYLVPPGVEDYITKHRLYRE